MKKMNRDAKFTILTIMLLVLLLGKVQMDLEKAQEQLKEMSK